MNIIIGIAVFAISVVLVPWLAIRWSCKTMIQRIADYDSRVRMYFGLFSKAFEKSPEQLALLFGTIIYRSRMDLARLAIDIVEWSRAGFVDMDDVLIALSACASRFKRLDELFQSSFIVERSPQLKVSAQIFADHLGAFQRSVAYLQVCKGLRECCQAVNAPGNIPTPSSV